MALPWNIIIPALIGAGGKKIQSDEQEKALKKKREELLKGRKKARSREMEQFQKAMATAREVAPEARGQKMATATAEHEGRINDVATQLLNEAPQGEGGDRISDASATRQAKNLSNLAKEASTIASIKSRLRAPQAVQGDQNQLMRELGIETQDAGRDIRQMMSHAENRGEIRGRPNSSRMMLGGLAEGLGTSIATGQILGALKAPAAMKTGGMSMDPTYNPNADFFSKWGVKK